MRCTKMKSISHVVPGFGWALFVCVVAAVCCCTAGGAREEGYSYFTANGKRISATTYQAYKLKNEALRLMQQNKTKEAVVLLKRAIKTDPSLAEVHGMLGMALARVGRTEEATDEMRMAIVGQHDQKTIWVLMDLAAVYQANGQPKEAVEVYKKILAEYPEAAVSEALEDRIKLLERELKRQHTARTNSIGTNANAYSTADYVVNVTGNGRKRWPAKSMPLHVYIYPGEGLDGWRPQYDKILRDSFSEWQHATNNKITFKYQNIPHDADIVCTWIDDPKLLESSAEGGETEVASYLGSIVKSKILLSLNESGNVFPYTDNLVRMLCLHEIGHALGLVGHSTDPKDIMYCTTPIVDNEQHLSIRDKQTANTIYSTDVDMPSQLLADIDHQTHGNTILVLRTAIGGTILIVIIAIGVSMTIAKTRRNRRKAK